jgi:hypothetical protein
LQREILKYPYRKSKLLKKALVISGKFTYIGLSHYDWQDAKKEEHRSI